MRFCFSFVFKDIFVIFFKSVPLATEEKNREQMQWFDLFCNSQLAISKKVILKSHSCVDSRHPEVAFDNLID